MTVSSTPFPPLQIPVQPLAVLASGGLDSAILLADLARQLPSVVPLYIRCGLAWEETELDFLRQYLDRLRPRFAAIASLVILDQPTLDLYGSHWSITSQAVPDAASPDEAVYLPGRNLLLLTKALLWCHLHGYPGVALGVLASNPFPDASPAFFADLAKVVSTAVGTSLQVFIPYGQLNKNQVMHRGQDLPLEWSFSCIAPTRGRHCGSCNKCAERQRAFAEVGWPDPTVYASLNPACNA
jgi:7-cyano-7-deazaguanine synthase